MPRVDSDEENQPPQSVRSLKPYALDLSTRKKLSRTDPLIHYGRHYGRTVQIFCNMHVLLTNGILRTTDPDYDMNDDTLPLEERRENRLFEILLKTIPGVEDRIAQGCSADDLRQIADLKGCNGARADDTKTMKGAVLDWITPRGVPLNPPLTRHMKADRGFQHDTTGRLLCPANLNWDDPEVRAKLRDGDYVIDGDEWPVFLYENYQYDPEDPWKGLFRSKILLMAFRHVFTCPSSAVNPGNTSRGGNARVHGMTKVSIPAIAYAATQLRFALSSCQMFSRTDKTTDSQKFYSSIIEWLEEPEEIQEVTELLSFWNREIFPQFMVNRRTLAKDSVLAKLRAKRAALRERTAAEALMAVRQIR